MRRYKTGNSKNDKRNNLRKDLRDEFENICAYCGIDLMSRQSHIDHVIPMSKGGFDEYSNLVISCEFCNMAKNDLDVIIFLEWLAHIRSNSFQCNVTKKVKHLTFMIDDFTHDKLQKSWMQERTNP